jgi:GH24 family phage-related lysozyme (muramidase)
MAPATIARVRAAAEHAARQGQLTPQQLAALSWLDEQLTPAQQQQFTELWRAEGSPALPGGPAWLAPSLALLREFEGLRTKAYRDAVGVWTIGYGSTRYSNGPVRQGDTITAADAEAMMAGEVLDLFGPGLLHLLPMAVRWPPSQQAVLISWAYNIGLGAVEDSTLRRRLLAGEAPATVIREELPRWNKGDGGKVLDGLTNRRAAEVAQFLALPRLTATPQQPASTGLALAGFPFCDQTDNGPEGWRQCQTSSIAMALIYLKTPGIRSDLDYLKVVQRHGDTTSQEAHRLALAELGVRARFRQNLTHGEALAELKAGLPVVAGVLHHGPVSAPSGGGHYVAIWGATATHWQVHDPYGELDLVNGGWSRQGDGAGRGVSYSFRNFDPRWLVESPASGWGWVFS